ncbi:hypothetical protein LGL08_16150 [Clostridium estertheticum]|uniref:hypothetical protein n=1 Tax=Clostridium estertheticum TaxID=238834 RepID=UPI001CF0F553|nr:hypothetical protein [Clostridium estertheticum]MCB2307566.1 hypothetical protein [Clostridium estertheticum]MCB2347180.1 hypothetical protein [Clostridium estertheticum]MCB2351056.1 hypothetical protein [Clostridium estertheticum]WAG46726.1 hypothetical protein LL127_04020 [Clostridium estertheticum]
MKINKIISWLNITRILLKVGGILFYISSIFEKNNLLNNWIKLAYGNTKVYVPMLTKYQFSVIKTVPLFIVILIGLQRFSIILKSIESKKTPFCKESVAIFKNFAKTILVYGAIKAIISVCGGFMGLIPTNEFSLEVVILIFPIEYVIASLMIYGVAYIIDLGVKLQSENDMFI